MDRAEHSFEYAKAVQKIIDAHVGEYHKAVSLIIELGYPNYVHPMLISVHGIAENIDEDYHSNEVQEQDWTLLKKKVAQFLAYEWAPTCWSAIASYGFEENGRLQYSYGVSFVRRNGKTVIESGRRTLAEPLQRFADSLEQAQTDEWFMINLIHKLPQKVDGLLLQHIGMIETTSGLLNE